ncbi:hypothetical protein ACLOJK_004770, partial [Asimina triloba]
MVFLLPAFVCGSDVSLRDGARRICLDSMGIGFLLVLLLPSSRWETEVGCHGSLKDCRWVMGFCLTPSIEDGYARAGAAWSCCHPILVGGPPMLLDRGWSFGPPMLSDVGRDRCRNRNGFGPSCRDRRPWMMSSLGMMEHPIAVLRR